MDHCTITLTLILILIHFALYVLLSLLLLSLLCVDGLKVLQSSALVSSITSSTAVATAGNIAGKHILPYPTIPNPKPALSLLYNIAGISIFPLTPLQLTLNQHLNQRHCHLSNLCR